MSAKSDRDRVEQILRILSRTAIKEGVNGPAVGGALLQVAVDLMAQEHGVAQVVEWLRQTARNLEESQRALNS